MPTSVRFSRWAASALGAGLLVLSPPLWGKKGNPTSKLYVADLEGEAEIDTGERIEPLDEKSVHNAQGTVIVTKPTGSNAMVFSNGTGVYFAPDTRLEVRRFVQEPFSPNRPDIEVEPSISQTQTYLPRGTVGLCTSRLVAGSTMVYSTPHASISIRGRKVLIETTEFETRISLVEGDVTVRGGEQDAGGETLRGGQQAIIRRMPGREPEFIVQPIPDQQRAAVDEQVSLACMARRTVYFDVADRANGDEGEDALGRTAGPGVFDPDEPDDDGELVVVPVTPIEPPVDTPLPPPVSASAISG